MNTHLNIFRTYAKENRLFQLENDLTRALAICMQEDALFFHEILKAILDDTYSSELFNDLSSSNEVSINIQKNSKEIADFEKVYAVSLSEHEMNPKHFWNQSNDALYDPICDIVIRINDIIILIEAKRDNVDCTAQLFNQALNVCDKNDLRERFNEIVVPIDLNWSKLMEIAVKTHSFERAASNPNRFLNDFIDLVKNHNFRWLPEPSIYSISPENTEAISRRIESAINEIDKKEGFSKLEYSDRMGLWFDQPWAQELILKVKENGDLFMAVYPGNTKWQGRHIFKNDLKPKEFIHVQDKQYQLEVSYHIKFTSFQKYFTGLWFKDKNLSKELYTPQNYRNHSGRNLRDKDWEDIENLFKNCFKENYNWKEECAWESKVIQSGKNQFDMSFGYELSIEVPFKDLREKDQNKADLTGLTEFIEAVYNEFRTVYK